MTTGKSQREISFKKEKLCPRNAILFRKIYKKNQPYTLCSEKYI